MQWLNPKSDKIYQYLRDKNHKPIGVLIAVAEPTDCAVHLGWSLCSKRDIFDRQRGLIIAEGRANQVGTFDCIPHSLRKCPLKAFETRAEKYFHRQVHLDVVSPGLTD